MLGLLAKNRIQTQVAAGLRRTHGLGFFEARRLASTVDMDTIQTAAASCSETVQAKVAEIFAPQAIGDGTILQAILDFFNSPLGQELLKALMKLLLGLI